MGLAENTVGGLPPFVDAGWLPAHLGQVVVVDLRRNPDGGSAADAYRAGHIPGAVLVDFDSCCAGPSSPAEGSKPLPAPEDFARCLAQAGIGDAATVVVYDHEGAYAARLVWMLRALGGSAAVLDGGLAAWPGPLERGDSRPALAARTARPWPGELLVSIDQVDPRGSVVVDARQAERYRGQPSGLDRRAGHIPGAVNLPWREHIDPSTRLVPREILAERFASAGITEGTPVVSYCGSGTSACHNLLVMEWLGLGRGRLFAGSWSQWSLDEDRPVATGPDPGDPAAGR
jgi:thiosulfate/3-mercaptopyruvate sulfurtransferase